MRLAVVSHRSLDFPELIEGLIPLHLEVTELIFCMDDPSADLLRWFADRFGLYSREVDGLKDIPMNCTGIAVWWDGTSWGTFHLLKSVKRAKLDSNIILERGNEGEDDTGVAPDKGQPDGA